MNGKILKNKAAVSLNACIITFLIIFLKDIVLLILFKTKLEPVSQMTAGILTLAASILAGIVLQFVFKTDNSTGTIMPEQEELRKKAFSDFLKKSFSGIWFALAVTVILSAFSLYTLPLSIFNGQSFLPASNMNEVTFLQILPYSLAVILITLLLFYIANVSCIMFLRGNLYLSPVPALKSAITFLIKTLFMSLRNYAVGLLSAGTAIIFFRLLSLWMSMPKSDITLAFIYSRLFAAFICGLFLYVFLRILSDAIVKEIKSEVLPSSVSGQSKPGLAASGKTELKSGALQALISCAVLLLFAVAILIFPKQNKVIDTFLQHAQWYERIAASAGTAGDLHEQGINLRRAAIIYASLSDFVSMEQIANDRLLGEEDKLLKIKAHSDRMNQIALLDGQNGYLYYLRGIRQEVDGNDPVKAEASFRKAYELLPGFSDACFQYMKTIRQSDDAAKKETAVERVIRSGQFTCSAASTTASPLSLKIKAAAWDMQFRELLSESSCLAEYYYNNRLFQESKEELDLLRSYLPEDDNIDRLTALTDLELKSDGKPYDAAVQSAANLKQRHPDDRDTLVFAALVEWSAFRNDTALATMKDCVQRFPDDIEIAEEYLYMLFSASENKNYGDDDILIFKEADRVLAIAGDSWFSWWVKACQELKKRDYVSALANLSYFSEILEPFDNMRVQYDDYTYSFAMKYSDLYGEESAQKALEAIRRGNPFIYDYIYGISMWRSKNYEQSHSTLEKLTQDAGELAKVRFILGNLYFEQAAENKQKELYRKAADEFTTSLCINANDAYCWYSLGLVYDSLENYEASLGAMMKANYLMPYLDHRTDHMGVSYHSNRLIGKLKKYLDSREGVD